MALSVAVTESCCITADTILQLQQIPAEYGTVVPANCSIGHVRGLTHSVQWQEKVCQILWFSALAAITSTGRFL